MMKTCLIIFTVLIQAILFGQDQSITATVSSDSVLIGNTIIYKVSLSNVDGDFETPEFGTMEIVSGPNLSQSVSIINGASESSKSYTWYLKPIELGQYFIGPSFVRDGDQLLEANVIELNVYPNPEGIIDSPQMESESMFFQYDLPDMFQQIDPFGQRKQEKEEETKPKRKLKKF